MMTSGRRIRWAAAALLGTAVGCASVPEKTPVRSATATASAQLGTTAHASQHRTSAEILPCAALEPASQEEDNLAVNGQLSLERLIEAVQERNPSILAAVEAWRAAAERYPQVVSLEDPMFGFMRGTNEGWMVETRQKLPWPGKRWLRGDAAAAEANAACQEVADTRLRLTEATRVAYFDYYQAQRELEVNAANLALLDRFRKIAQVRYEANQVTQQDVLQADVEIADLGTRTAELQRAKQVAAARINTLLHRAADYPLPAPPANVAMPDNLPPAKTLQALAIERRPDLAAQLARIEAEEANVCLAWKEYYPDMEVAYKYDAFMPPEMRSQVGMNVNVPIYREKRHAAVREMSAKLRQQRAEYQNRVDEAAFEVQSAVERIGEGRKIVELYTAKILPAARLSVESALTNYEAGRLDFLRLIEAQRQLRVQEEKYHQSVAEYHRRLAELDRAIGAPASVPSP